MTIHSAMTPPATVQPDAASGVGVPRSTGATAGVSPPPRQPPPPLDDPEAILARLDELEEQVHDLHDQLIHAQRLATLGTLTATLAHEYNNLLTPMLSYAQMALARPDDTELLRKAAEKTLHGGTQAARISSALLHFASPDARRAPATAADRPDADEAAPDTAPASEPAAPAAHLPTVLEDALACLARDPSKDGITLHHDLPDTPARIEPTHLQHVLLNLLLNARKAMAPEGGTLSITATAQNDRLILKVADTGPGIPPEVRPRLFEPFATGGSRGSGLGDQGSGQSDANGRGAPSGCGTGLGLALCRTLIEQAGGTIHLAEDNPAADTGATFIINLPRA